MSLLEQQNFLAKLYTDEKIRREFLSEPEKIGKENFLNEKEISDIKEILPGEINAFADSLFYKRLREVERLLPLTRKILEDSFENYFREFSREFNPKSVKKHLEDAIEYAGFLRQKEFQSMWMKDLITFEKARLEFFGSGNKLLINVYDFDLRNVSFQIGNADFEFKRRKTLDVWIRFGKRAKHLML